MSPFRLPDGRWIHPDAIHSIQLYLSYDGEVPHFVVYLREPAGDVSSFRYNAKSKKQAELEYAATVESWNRAAKS